MPTPSPTTTVDASGQRSPARQRRDAVQPDPAGPRLAATSRNTARRSPSSMARQRVISSRVRRQPVQVSLSSRTQTATQGEATGLVVEVIVFAARQEGDSQGTGKGRTSR